MLTRVSSDLSTRWTTRRSASSPAALALGAMNFGKRTPADESERIVARAIDLGIELVDTANVYNDGESERIVGRALRGKRDRVLVATKVGLARIGGKPEGLSRARILAAVDESLRRLGTDVIDVYYLHAPDPSTPIEETALAMAELLRAGKIRAIGVSNYASWQILELRALCAEIGAAPPSIAQMIYNVLIRQIEIEYVPFAAKYGVHTTVYNPLAGGLLSGRYARGDAVASGSRFDGNKMYQRRYFNDRMLELVEALAAIAADEAMSLVDLAYAWVAGRPGTDSILIGPATVEHLEAAVSGCAKRLSVEALARIDALYQSFQGTDARYAR
jgi:aryl-alcohol dehydrogenase-like predicted oxidoreductase